MYTNTCLQSLNEMRLYLLFGIFLTNPLGNSKERVEFSAIQHEWLSILKKQLNPLNRMPTSERERVEAMNIKLNMVTNKSCA